MKCARPTALRTPCATFRPCLSPSPLAFILQDARAQITSRSNIQDRVLQKHIASTLRAFSTSPPSSARSRFASRFSPADSNPHTIQKTGRAAARAARRRTAQGEDEDYIPTWQDYDPEIGIPLPSGELDQSTIHNIFGPEMDDAMGNHILRIMHFRRVSGSLIDVGINFQPSSGISPEMATKALDYVRSQDPDFDENESGAAWAEAEIAKVEQQYVTRAENLGLYKRDKNDPAPENTQAVSSNDIYGESALDQLRKLNKARWMEADRKKKEAEDKKEAERIAALKAEGRQEPATQTPGKIYSEFDALALAQPVQKAWLQPVERKPWVKYYEEQATIIKDNKVPNLSLLQRLGPSALLALLFAGGCWALNDMYTPPPRSARMFPDMPPAVATLGAITVANFVVFVAWRIPPLWRTMNTCFQVTAAYPFAIATIGAQFSHQSFRHFFVNTVVLWPFGLLLHDDVGRGSFLAIYLGCGVMGTFGSLVFNVLSKRWTTYSFGSSTAVFGTLAAACLVRANNNVTVLGYEIPDVTGMTMLGILAGMEILRAWRGRATNVDYAGHLSGLAAGVVSGLYVRSQAANKQMTRKDVKDVEAPKVVDTTN